MPENVDRLFLEFSAKKLGQLAGRITECLGRLSEEQVWARGSDNENAVGNLVLHLCGNLRQWIGFGVAGKPDIRVRDQEFAARGGITVAELSERLKATVQEVADTLKNLPTERLVQRTKIQSYEILVLEAIFHVVEHFAQHTGQIIFATKMLTGDDLGFYKHLGKPAHQEKTP